MKQVFITLLLITAIIFAGCSSSPDTNLKDDVNRWIGNITLNWSPKDWINITYAAQVDNYSDQRNRFVAPDLDTGTQVGGFIVEQDVNFTGLESNFLVNMTHDFSEDFGAELTLGNQISDSKRDFTYVRGETLNVPGINDLANTINTFAGNTVRELKNIGVIETYIQRNSKEAKSGMVLVKDWLITFGSVQSLKFNSESMGYENRVNPQYVAMCYWREDQYGGGWYPRK